MTSRAQFSILNTMHEYVSDALVLHGEPQGDLDVRFSLFTRRFGKMIAKAKSARKITSKLSPHLTLGNIVKARIVEKGGYQLVDALKQSATALDLVTLASLNRLLSESGPEPELWHLLSGGSFSWARALRILGWDPAHASCARCEKSAPSHFSLATQEFFCAACVSGIRANEVVYIG